MFNNFRCLQTLRSAPRRKGHAIVAVVVKSGSCSFVLWQRFATVHVVSSSRGILMLPSSDFGLRPFVDPAPSNRCDILPDSEPPLCQHCKQYGFDCTFFLPIAETRFKKKKQEEEAAAAAVAVAEKTHLDSAERPGSSTPGESSRPSDARVYGMGRVFRWRFTSP